MGYSRDRARMNPRQTQRIAPKRRYVDPDTRVAELAGEPVGFCIVKGDELYQLFVSAPARGTGLAAELAVDAEARMAAKGVAIAWLACAIGNDRAARFYGKCGWRCTGTVINPLDLGTCRFDLEVWRYEKSLAPALA